MEHLPGSPGDRVGGIAPTTSQTAQPRVGGGIAPTTSRGPSALGGEHCTHHLLRTTGVTGTLHPPPPKEPQCLGGVSTHHLPRTLSFGGQHCTHHLPRSPSVGGTLHPPPPGGSQCRGGEGWGLHPPPYKAPPCQGGIAPITSSMGLASGTLVPTISQRAPRCQGRALHPPPPGDPQCQRVTAPTTSWGPPTSGEGEHYTHPPSRGTPALGRHCTHHLQGTPDACGPLPPPPPGEPQRWGRPCPRHPQPPVAPPPPPRSQLTAALRPGPG